MSGPLRSSSITSTSNRSTFTRRRFVTLQLADLPLPGSSSIPSLSTGASTAASLSVETLFVVSLPVVLPSVELPSIEPSPAESSLAEPSSAEPSSKISSSGRFSFAESSVTTFSSPGPRLLEPRSFGTRLNGPPVAGRDYQVSNGASPEVYHVDVKTFSTTSPCIIFNLPAFGYDGSDILAVVGKVSGVGGFASDACHHCAETWEMCITPSTLKIFLKAQGVSLSNVTGGSEYLEPDSHCKMVFIKCPRGCNSDESKRSHYASAWGVYQGLHEFPLRGLGSGLPKMRSEINMGYWRTWSKKVYCVSSIEREDCGLLMIATNSRTNGNLREISAVMNNPIDVKPTQDALKKIKDDGGYLIQVFASVNPNKSGAGGS
ncbi:hypothetical protein BOTCAL_0331g00080 [Botryotinia calthae]|uniref:Uncharacterized protein n=1 Tax=Botryotinia calthae TaxID=38488 RepID=A0A4Y8CT83_9HELO|nr:hypothetical protein BOTCAL_0331g00080 [Botryotinia calthae]